MNTKYKVMDEKDFENLRAIINDDERVLVKDSISEDYSHDELNTVRHEPDMVLRVICTEEVSKIMKYANAHLIPVTPRGAGTGLVGSAVPVLGGIVIDLTLMDKILELDEENLTLTVEPGVLLMNIAKYVEEHDLFYPPDPGEKTATIGGNITTNAGGMRAVKYGVTRDYVRGLEVVLPDERIIEVGGKVVKNSSGYDLKDLIIGCEGTLGIVTKAILKLIPLPKTVVSILVPFNSLDDAIGAVPEIIKSKAVPTAIEFMEKEIIKDAEEFLGKDFPDDTANAYLLLTFDGVNKADVESQYRKVADICLELGAIDAFISDTEERQEIVWKTREGFLEAVKSSTSEVDEVDVVVPRNKVADFVKFTKDVKEKINIRIKSFGHAGDGNLHIYMLRDELNEEEWHKRLEESMNLMYEKAKSYGGKVSGEHAIGFAKKTYLRESLPLCNIDLMKGIKEVFDPNHILNPKKIMEE